MIWVVSSVMVDRLIRNTGKDVWALASAMTPSLGKVADPWSGNWAVPLPPFTLGSLQGFGYCRQTRSHHNRGYTEVFG